MGRVNECGAVDVVDFVSFIHSPKCFCMWGEQCDFGLTTGFPYLISSFIGKSDLFSKIIKDYAKLLFS